MINKDTPVDYVYEVRKYINGKPQVITLRVGYGFSGLGEALDLSERCRKLKRKSLYKNVHGRRKYNSTLFTYPHGDVLEEDFYMEGMIPCLEEEIRNERILPDGTSKELVSRVESYVRDYHFDLFFS